MNKTNRFLLAIIFLLILIILYQAFFILKIKNDLKNKSISSFRRPRFNVIEDFEKDFNGPFNDDLHKRLYEKLNSEFFQNDLFHNEEITESENEYIVKIKIPNFDREKININIENNALVISGKQSIEKHNSRFGNFYSYSSNSFNRVIPLPGLVNENEITSSYENGILTIILKKEENLNKKTKPVLVL